MGKRYCPEDYLEAAKSVAALMPMDCGESFWKQRCQVAEQLRLAAAQPDHPQNRAILTALRLFVRK